MWSEDEKPQLSIGELANYLGKSLKDTKAIVEDYNRVKDGQALQIEKKAAEIRYRQGPRRVNENLGDAFPEISMSKRRWLQLFRASKVEKGDRGGSLLGEDSDFTDWLLRRPDMEHLKVTLAKTTNKIGWTSPLVNARLSNAADFGRRERAGRAILDPTTGGWLQ
jgi:hypothetical protein